MLTHLYFFYRKDHLFLIATGVKSASFNLGGNAPLVIFSLKGQWKPLTVVSELDFIIFRGISLCVVVFLGFRSLISNSISLNDSVVNLTLFPLELLFLIREMLGWDSNLQ